MQDYVSPSLVDARSSLSQPSYPGLIYGGNGASCHGSVHRMMALSCRWDCMCQSNTTLCILPSLSLNRRISKSPYLTSTYLYTTLVSMYQFAPPPFPATKSSFMLNFSDIPSQLSSLFQFQFLSMFCLLALKLLVFGIRPPVY